MFEKEAEEYAEGTKTEKELEVLNIVQDWGQESLTPEERILLVGIQDREREREQGFKDGAEFGYNKAKVEVEESYKESLCNSELNLASVTEQLEELEKANEWHYVKEGCKYPENGESVLVTVLDDDNEKIVTMALFEVENNKRFWDIESRLCSIHSGSEEVCSKIIAWARVLPAGGEK